MSSTHTHGSLSSSSTHNSISFLRASKSGFAKTGKERKEQGRKGSGQAEEKEEWYIPYKGPYEPAPVATTTTTSGSKKRALRDSWGDPVPGVGDGDGVDSHQSGMNERRRDQQRPRSQSHSSNPIQPRSNYSSQSPKIPSYINLDAAGGVGNSPVPPSTSSSRMLHVSSGGTERPWSAREARVREGEEPRTLRQRSSLASLFEKKYSLLKKLSLAKLGLGGAPSVVAVEEREPVRVDDSGSAEKRESQPPPRPPRQRPMGLQSPQHQAGDDRRDDITVVTRSPKTESVSVYSQPSPFVPMTQPAHTRQEEQKDDKEWVPIVRLTPPPASAPVDPPLTASTVSSFASKQKTMSSAEDSLSHSRSNSHSQSQHSTSAPPAVPLGTVDEDDTHVESYYDMLITSSVDTPPPVNPAESVTSNDGEERHPYAYALTFPSGHIGPSDPVYSHRMTGKQKTRLSPIPQSRPSLATMRSVASSPDLRRRGQESNDDVQRMEGVDVSRLRPHVREKLQSTGGRGKERWLSTDLIAIFLPKPKFKIKAKAKKSTPDLASHDNAPSSHVPNDTHHMAEFGVVADVQKSSLGRRKSYAYDDLSLLSLDKVLEERDKLEKDRIKWQAQAVKSIGNRHARIVSRSRSKSLTQTGRKMRSIPGPMPPPPQQHRPYHTRGQQSSIDYLAARACLGDQDSIPLVDEDDTVVDIGPTPTTVRRPQFDFPQRHERMPSGSSGLATSSGGHRSSNGVSAQSGSVSTGHHHKRNDSWSRSAVRIVKSVPQLCGVGKDDDDDEEDQNNNKRIQQQLQPQQVPPARLSEVNDAATPVTLLNPDNNENRKPSPSLSNTSGGAGVIVGIAISTPPEAAYRDYHHPYTVGADRGVDGSKLKEETKEAEEDSTRQAEIRLPDHPYAQGGLASSSSISRCAAGEREPDYVGPHRAVAVPMTKELMADLGLSELSARHRLPPHVRLVQQPSSSVPLIRLESGSQGSQSEVQLPVQEQEQGQEQEQNKKSSNQLYVRVDDTRNSYQDLQPYVRADSNAPPPDRLWVTYSPGTVREVMPNEVFQYSPFISNQVVAHVAAASTSSHPDPGPDLSPVSASGEGTGTDFFLQRYQRMSTVYQDTVSMSQALGNAMYDSSSTQDARRREKRRRSVDSGTNEEHQQANTTGHSAETSASQEEHQLLTLRYTATPPPRVLFGPRLNTTPQKPTTENLSASRVSSPILPRQSPVVFTDPFPGRGGRGGGRAVSVASPDHSSSGISTSPPTSPTVPRVGSPDNLEPFHGLFYRPPGGSESDSPIPSPSPHLARNSDPDDVEEEDPSHLLLDDDAQWIPRLGGSVLTTLMKEVSDEWEQMDLERQREEQRERSGSIRSSNTLQSRTSDSVSVSTSTTSKGGSSGVVAEGGRRSRRINTEAGPLDFVLDRSMLPQQDATQSGYVPRPNRVSTFYPSTPIPEDIEFSRASSPFEGTAEDVTVRVPVGSNTNVAATQSTTTSNTSYAPLPPRPSAYPTEEEYMAMYYPEGMRASYHTTTDTLSRISTLSQFPIPPKDMTPEEISILAAQPR